MEGFLCNEGRPEIIGPVQERLNQFLGKVCHQLHVPDEEAENAIDEKNK